MRAQEQFSASGKDLALLLEAGLVCRYAGRFRDAREIFQGVRALAANKEIGDLALAGVDFEEGKLDEADAACRRALKINPGCAIAYAQLAEIYIVRKDRDATEKALRRASELDATGSTAPLVRELRKLAAAL